MRGYVVQEKGRAGWQDVPVPEIGPYDALVRPTAVATCTTDVHLTDSLSLPNVNAESGLAIGGDVVGIIDNHGQHGGYSECIVLDARSVTPKPARADFPEAASFLMNALTVRTALDALALPRIDPPGHWRRRRVRRLRRAARRRGMPARARVHRDEGRYRGEILERRQLPRCRPSKGWRKKIADTDEIMLGRLGESSRASPAGFQVDQSRQHVDLIGRCVSGCQSGRVTRMRPRLPTSTWSWALAISWSE
jgi:hypothetical protein